MMRGVGLLLTVLLTAGCYSSSRYRDPPDSGNDDPGIEDGPWDADPDPDPDPDPDIDPDPEPECVPVTDGICHVVEQCGCDRGSYCTLVVDTATCLITEDCTPSPGSRSVGEECDARGQCRPGTVCLADGAEPGVGRCYEWCRLTADCSLVASECGLEVGWPLSPPCSGTADVPYRVCTVPCPEDAGCDLFATGVEPTGCPTGQSCIHDGPAVHGGCDVTTCIPEGTGDPGEECEGIGCRRGAACYVLSGGMTRCLSYCTTDGIHPCTTGTCTATGSESWPELGVCL